MHGHSGGPRQGCSLSQAIASAFRIEFEKGERLPGREGRGRKVPASGAWVETALSGPTDHSAIGSDSREIWFSAYRMLTEARCQQATAVNYELSY